MAVELGGDPDAGQLLQHVTASGIILESLEVAVVAGTDLVAALVDDGSRARAGEGERGGQPGGAGARDGDLDHP